MPIRSSELATLVRLSPAHFSRAFRNSFGCSPLEYVTRRRMERAQGLMLSTDTPLSQIALDCGLADQAHFSRLFRRVVGETPRAWRRARVAPLAARARTRGVTNHANRALRDRSRAHSRHGKVGPPELQSRLRDLGYYDGPNETAAMARDTDRAQEVPDRSRLAGHRMCGSDTMALLRESYCY